MRTLKVNTASSISFISLLGQGGSVFGATFYKDGVAQAGISHTVTELSLGRYLINFTPTAVGFWVVVITPPLGGATSVEAEVVANTVDDLYTLVSGQVGSNSVTLTLQDSGTSAAVPGVVVNVYNSANTVFICSGTTDSNGKVVFVLDAATYKLRVYKLGIATTEAGLTVTSASTQSHTVALTAVSVSAPSTPATCRLFADFVKLNGTAYGSFKVKVQNMYLPTANMAVVQSESTHTANSSGRVEIDVVQGTKIKVSFINTAFTREVIVPATTTSNLLTLMGAATDPFVVVT